MRWSRPMATSTAPACSAATRPLSAALSRRLYARGSGARPGRTDALLRRKAGRSRRAPTGIPATNHPVRLKLYVAGVVPPLSASLPVFENLGFPGDRRDSYPVALGSDSGAALEGAVFDFLMQRTDNRAAELEAMKAPLEDAFHAVVSGEAESDGFNRLVVNGGLACATSPAAYRSPNICARPASLSARTIWSRRCREIPTSPLLVEFMSCAAIPTRRTATRGSRPSPNASSRRWTTYPVSTTTASSAASATWWNPCATLFPARREGMPRPISRSNSTARSSTNCRAGPDVEIFVYSPQVEGVHLRFGKLRAAVSAADRREGSAPRSWAW